MVNRFILKELEREMAEPEVLILLGPRQVGKTTLLKQLQADAGRRGVRTAFYDLEQPQVLAEFNRPDPEIIEKIRGSGEAVFIDEFQYIRNASKILKAVFDSGSRVKLICSGSSSIEIHKHLKESLAGRRMLLRVYPLRYSELKAHDRSYPLETYLRYGGMPALTRVVSDERKQKLLSELLSAYVLKDVKSLLKEENVRAFNHLLYLLAQNQGSPISVHSLANEVGLSSKTLVRYLDILEETFTNYRVMSFSNNLANELKKSCKSYLYDLGIRNALLKDFSPPAQRPDKGAILESFVFLRLRDALGPNREVKFWRTKQGEEVDFVFLRDRKPTPIEVKSDIRPGTIPKGLRKFVSLYPQVRLAFILNEKVTQTLSVGNCEVRFQTFEVFDRELEHQIGGCS